MATYATRLQVTFSSMIIFEIRLKFLLSLNIKQVTINQPWPDFLMHSCVTLPHCFANPRMRCPITMVFIEYVISSCPCVPWETVSTSEAIPSPAHTHTAGLIIVLVTVPPILVNKICSKQPSKSSVVNWSDIHIKVYAFSNNSARQRLNRVSGEHDFRPITLYMTVGSTFL